LDDFAWICSGAVWVKPYNDSLTATSATDPTVLEQCGTTPTDCGDLVGWPATDLFDGVGCSSASVGDTNWGLRGWDCVVGGSGGSGSNTIVSSVLNITLQSLSSATYVRQCTVNAVASGQVVVELDCTQAPNSASAEYIGYALYVYFGGVAMRLEVAENSTNNVLYRAGAESIVSTGDTYGPLRAKIVRKADNKVEFYLGGVLKGTSINAYAGAMGDILVQTFIQGTTSKTFKFPYITVQDGSSNDIIAYDPTGESCT